MVAISGSTLSQTAAKALGPANSPASVRETAHAESTSTANVARASQGSAQETISSPIKYGKDKTLQIPPKVQNTKDPDGRSEDQENAKDEASKELEKNYTHLSRIA